MLVILCCKDMAGIITSKLNDNNKNYKHGFMY